MTNFDHLIRPRAVAIVGASTKRDSIGEHPLRFLTQYGFDGEVYPVNPNHQEMGGRRCYPDILSVPRPTDIALIAVGAQHVPEAIEQCEAAGIPFAIVLSAGFRELGERGQASEERLKKSLSSGRVRLIGPNCLGMLNVKDKIHCGFGGTMSNPNLKPGRIAMVTHSGGWGTGAVDLCDQNGVGFNYVISTGNETDVTALEIIPYLLKRDDVDAVAAFLEGSTDGRGLLQVGEEALARGKPVILWKIGNSKAGLRAVASHTGRLTGDATLFQRAVKTGGFIEIGDTEDLIDVARLLQYGKKPKGKRIAAMSFSGGTAVLMGDQSEQHGLEVPITSEASQKRILDAGMPFVAAGNPFDLTPQIYMEGFGKHGALMKEVLTSGEFDQVIVRSAPEPRTEAWAQQLAELDETTDIPIVVTWGSGSERVPAPKAILDSRRIPYFQSVRRAIRAMASLTLFAEKVQRHRTSAKDSSAPPISLAFPDGAHTLGEHVSKQLLAKYGVPCVAERLIDPVALMKIESSPLPFPLVVKIESADIPHKTEADAVRLKIGDLAALKEAGRVVVENGRRYAPGAKIDGVLVQEMASGLEIIVGALDDPDFGPVIMVGLGGIFAEGIPDVTHRFAPVSTATAREMLDELRGSALFRGYRGKPALDVDALAAIVANVSRMISDHQGKIAEIDINPVFLKPAGQGAVAADALIVLKTAEPSKLSGKTAS